MKISCKGSSEWPFAVPFQLYESMNVCRDYAQWGGWWWGGSVLELWAYNGLICSLTDTCMFSFDVCFDKTQRFISVRADSVYMCVEIQIGGQVDTKVPK